MDRKFRVSKISDVVIYPYYECCLSCKGCPAKRPLSSELGFLKSNPLDFERHIDIETIERLNSWNVKNYVILGGEPTLSREIPEIINMLNGRKVIVYTNAIPIYMHLKKNGFDKELEDFLGLVDRLIVSLEGDRDWTDYIRGKGVYDKVHYVIDRIADRVDLVVRMSYFRGNVDSVLREIKRLDEDKIPCILFPRIGEEMLSREETYYFYHVIASFERVDVLLPSYKNFLGVNPDGVGCPAGWAKACVLPDGHLTPCQWNFRVVAHLSWDDEHVEWAFRNWYLKYGRIRSECITCKYAFTCRGSCRVAKDYLYCPVRDEMTLRDVDVRIPVLGEVREVRVRDVVARVRRLEGLIAHGCSAGC